jgi:hypothetical protein
VRFAGGLTAFRDPKLVAAMLDMLLTDEVPGQDVVPLFGRLLDNPAARDATWDFVRGNWKRVSKRVSPGLASRLVGALPALQTPARKREVASFFREHPLPTATRTLKQALERFDLNTALRKELVPKLRAWLRTR